MQAQSTLAGSDAPMALIVEDDPALREALTEEYPDVRIRSVSTGAAQTRPRQIPPVAVPDEHCAWCWPSLHPGQTYPEQWSSTICEGHSASIQAQHARLRIQRIAAKEMRTS